MAAAAKNYAEAGYKIQSTRIMRKDADLWVNQGVDVAIVTGKQIGRAHV